MEFSKRYLALGDSFTEGMGDVDPTRPNQVRGWADKVAEQLCQDPDWGYANLAIRGKKVGQIIDEQLPVALRMNPSLISLYMGGNDILRPRVDIDNLLQKYDAMVGELAGTGAQLLLFTGFDSNGSAIFEKTRGRTAIYNLGVRAIAERHGARVADYWNWYEFQDWRYWATDRLHMGAAGHTLMAKKVLGVLGEGFGLGPGPNAITDPVLPPMVVQSRIQKARADAVWAKEFLAPWIKRRLTGTSSGDHLSARYPQYISLQGLAS
ncbi:SGNH hydrolase [Arthrobacter sp. MYb227]|uniref:SGNH/GDSL hydrolase family protein n=1 Tax=Arthrobacter sp. MYb227 TaxID=1848601 RepID=UPI000CFC484F|nr:SGNH/GDSL hydrolase family protein [Arthrobacter sp. MYb227]PQZ86412.1 SGNH hydrolase [Arthrobacter sp. MYb227]